MTLTQMIEYLQETGIETEIMDEIIIHLEQLNSIEPLGEANIPKDISEMKDYLATLNESEGIIAQISILTTHNLLLRQIKENKNEHTNK